MFEFAFTCWQGSQVEFTGDYEECMAFIARFATTEDFTDCDFLEEGYCLRSCDGSLVYDVYPDSVAGFYLDEVYRAEG